MLDISVLPKKIFNYNISAFIQYMSKKVCNYLFDEHHLKYFNNVSKKKRNFFIDNVYKKKNIYEGTKWNSDIYWKLSNVSFYTADWYDILYRLFFDASSRFYEMLLKHHTHNIPCIKFSPDDNFLLSCSVDKSISLWYPNNVKNDKLENNYNIYDNLFPYYKNEKKKKF